MMNPAMATRMAWKLIFKPDSFAMGAAAKAASATGGKEQPSQPKGTQMTATATTPLGTTSTDQNRTSESNIKEKSKSKTVLRIDSSTRQSDSWSRKAGDALLAQLAPEQVISRDLAKTPVPHLSQTTIEGFYADPSSLSPAHREALALSDELIGELNAADTIVITLPMYNFGLPSALKAWVDQVTRIGRTFAFDGQNFAGLVKDRRAFIIVAYGASGYSEGAMQAAEFAADYLRFLLGFLGFENITVIPLEGLNTGNEEAAWAGANAAIEAAAAA
jgi:FMN-dependent NADH-azoreductase